MENNTVDKIFLVILIGLGSIGGIMSLIANVTSLDIPDPSIVWVMGCFFIPIYYLLGKMIYFQVHLVLRLIITFLVSLMIVYFIVVRVALNGIGDNIVSTLLICSITIIAYVIEILIFLKKLNILKGKQADTGVDDPQE